MKQSFMAFVDSYRLIYLTNKRKKNTNGGNIG